VERLRVRCGQGNRRRVHLGRTDAEDEGNGDRCVAGVTGEYALRAGLVGLVKLVIQVVRERAGLHQ